MKKVIKRWGVSFSNHKHTKNQRLSTEIYYTDPESFYFLVVCSACGEIVEK